MPSRTFKKSSPLLPFPFVLGLGICDANSISCSAYRPSQFNGLPIHLHHVSSVAFILGRMTEHDAQVLFSMPCAYPSWPSIDFNEYPCRLENSVHRSGLDTEEHALAKTAEKRPPCSPVPPKTPSSPQNSSSVSSRSTCMPCIPPKAPVKNKILQNVRRTHAPMPLAYRLSTDVPG